MFISGSEIKFHIYNIPVVEQVSHCKLNWCLNYVSCVCWLRLKLDLYCFGLPIVIMCMIMCYVRDFGGLRREIRVFLTVCCALWYENQDILVCRHLLYVNALFIISRRFIMYLLWRLYTAQNPQSLLGKLYIINTVTTFASPTTFRPTSQPFGKYTRIHF